MLATPPGAVALLVPLLFVSHTLSARVTNPSKVPKNAALLSKVKSLTVRAGQKTSSRRVSPVPQLQCVGPANICKLYEVDVMRCTNEGSEYDQEDIQWSCKASLPEEFKLGSTDVICEGYESSEDPYILKGSCGVEYRMLLTEQGEQKYGRQKSSAGRTGVGEKTNSGETLAGWVFMVIFLGVLFIILRSLYISWQNDAQRRGGRRPGRAGGGGGGGGGGPGDDDPPPPYDPYPDSPPQPKKTRTYTPRASASRSAAGNQQGGWRPGFWTGTAAGAAAGYMAGNRSQARTQPETREAPRGGLFGGGAGSTWGRQPPSSSHAEPSSSSSASNSRYESTGFGGTGRR